MLAPLGSPAIIMDALSTTCCLQLWHAYLKERRLATRGLRPDHPHLSALVNTYERALVSMHKMPRIWLELLELLVDLQMVTEARRAFDRALASLPVTQHSRVWVLYLVRRDAVTYHIQRRCVAAAAEAACWCVFLSSAQQASVRSCRRCRWPAQHSLVQHLVLSAASQWQHTQSSPTGSVCQHRC